MMNCPVVTPNDELSGGDLPGGDLSDGELPGGDLSGVELVAIQPVLQVA